MFASGSTSVARNNPGYNPVGILTAPTLTSGTAYTNTNNVPVTLILQGGTVTQIALTLGTQASTNTGLTSGAFVLQPGGSDHRDIQRRA